MLLQAQGHHHQETNVRLSKYYFDNLIMNTLVIMTMLKCRSHDSALSEKKTGVKEENQVKRVWQRGDDSVKLYSKYLYMLDL